MHMARAPCLPASRVGWMPRPSTGTDGLPHWHPHTSPSPRDQGVRTYTRKGDLNVVNLDHSFTMSKPIDESWNTILDLERLVPCVEGGSVLETTGSESVKAQITVKMGAMSMKF